MLFLATFEAPLAFNEPLAIVTNRQSNHLTSFLRKKLVGKKRKAPSCSASPSSQGETKVELIDVNEHMLTRKVKKVGWLELEPIDMPLGSDFDLDSIDSL